MRLFWRRGYVATSMSDIYAATGLKPGSVYAAFTDKETLFRRAFEQYAGHFRATLPDDLEGLTAIAAWLDLQAQLAIDDKDRAGCLIVNTVMEREAHSASMRSMAEGRLREIRDFFATQLRQAIAMGELPPMVDVDFRADALLGAVVSIMGLGRAGADGRTIRNIAKAAFEPLRNSATGQPD